MSFFERRAAEIKIVRNPPKRLSTMQDGDRCGKLTKSFTGARFLVSPGDLQVRRRRWAPAVSAADRLYC